MLFPEFATSNGVLPVMQVDSGLSVPTDSISPDFPPPRSVFAPESSVDMIPPDWTPPLPRLQLVMPIAGSISPDLPPPPSK